MDEMDHVEAYLEADHSVNTDRCDPADLLVSERVKSPITETLIRKLKQN